MPEQSAFRHQFFRGTLLFHTAIFQHHDMIRTGHSAHSVSDDQYRLTAQKPRESSLYLGLIFHIQRGCGFVQQHDGSVFKQRACNGDALSLSAGEFGSIFSDGCLVALGQFADKLLTVGGCFPSPCHRTTPHLEKPWSNRSATPPDPPWQYLPRLL